MAISQIVSETKTFFIVMTFTSCCKIIIDHEACSPWSTCLYVCNQGAFADKITEVVDQLLIRYGVESIYFFMELEKTLGDFVNLCLNFIYLFIL